MSALPKTAVIPLFTDPQGAIRVRGTRVLLDTIVTAFRAGATAEEIVQKFPTVALADVYQIIAHYLNHAAEIDAYLTQRQGEGAALKLAMEKEFDAVGLRARLLARRKSGQADK
ncbi:MAG TPA: DUF433 domain-containing protein [Steroidobacteraceae bacterium]|nr:DUF433 domain-containing protein [Steroidobacteraceae bacterium]